VVPKLETASESLGGLIFFLKILFMYLTHKERERETARDRESISMGSGRQREREKQALRSAGKCGAPRLSSQRCVVVLGGGPRRLA